MLSGKLRDIFIFISPFQVVIYLPSCKVIFIPYLLINMAEGSSPGVGNVFFPVCQVVKFNVKIYVCVPMKNCVI